MALPIRPDLPKPPPPPPPPPTTSGSTPVAPVGAVTPARAVDSATSGAPSLPQDQVTTGFADHERPSAFEAALRSDTSAPRPSLSNTPDTVTEHVPERPQEPHGPPKPSGRERHEGPKHGGPKPGHGAAKQNPAKPDATAKPDTKTGAKSEPGAKSGAGRVRDTEILERRVPPDRARTVLEPTRTLPAARASTTGATKAQRTVTPTSPTVVTRAVRPSEVTKTQPITRAAPSRAGQVVAGAGLASAGASVANDVRRIANGEELSAKEVATNATKAGVGGATLAAGGAQLAKVTPLGLARATGVVATAATAAVSVHDNLERVRSGEISKSQAAANVTIDVGVSGLAALGGAYANSVVTGMLVGSSFGPGVGTALGFLVGTGIFLGTQTETGRALIDTAKKKGAELFSAGGELLEQATDPRVHRGPARE
jgi:hypothetical protein